MSQLTMLILTDIHYIGKAKHTCSIAKRKVEMAPELIEKLYHSVKHEEFDLIVLGGDITDNGKAQGAEDDLKEIRDLIGRFEKPVLSVRGNHDCPLPVFQDILGKSEEWIRLNGYQIIGFSDQYKQGGYCFRDWEVMEHAFKSAEPDMPIIVFQHSPVYPPIEEDSYPYNLSDAQKIMKYYQSHCVRLSVSGHLHRGINPVEKDGVAYITASSLCEEPFSYGILRLENDKINYSQKYLKE